MIPCPCCDVEKLSLTPIESFVLGLGLRNSMSNTESLASQMCDAHRMPLTIAMMTLNGKMVESRTR